MTISQSSRALVWRSGLLLLVLSLPACNTFPAADLAPTYERAQFVVPASWHGSSPFVEARPSDGELRQDWWKVYNDPILNKLEEQALAANPDLQAAAERFVQARDVMMRARSQYLPRAGLELGASDNKQSIDKLFRPPNISEYGTTVYGGGSRPGSRIFGRRFAMPRALSSTAPKSAPQTMGPPD